MDDTPRTPAQGDLSPAPKPAEAPRPIPLDEVYCLWEQGGKDFRIGLIGTGPGLSSFLEIVWGEQYREFLPDMALVALAEPEPYEGRLEPLTAKGVQVYGRWQDMLAAHPEINLLVDFSGSPAKRAAIRQALSDGVSFIDHASVVFLCGLNNLAKASAYCQRNLRTHQALLEAIIDEVKEDILLLDRNWQVVDANESVCARSGRPKEELLGQPCWKVQTMDEGGEAFCRGADVNCPYARSLKTGKKAEAMMTRVDEDGCLRYFRVYSYPIHDAGGRISHIMIMRRDITERTRREKTQQQAEKLAVIGEMSTFLAHEIRNPLFAIAGFTNSLRKSQNLTDKEREKLDIIADEARRLDSMLTSILNFARPHRHEPGQADLCKVIAETVELMSMGYRPQGIEFVTACEPNLPRISAEPELLKQCLVNVIKNGIEAMGSGGTIRISCGRDDGMVRLAVTDSGKGMSQKELEKAFSPFYTTKERGYGLGLAMIKKIAEEYGGGVELASTEGKGTTVTLRFPAVTGDQPRGGRPEIQAI